MKTLHYPIRAVSKLTGISIDTLRAWERRYQVVTPERDERGRIYTEADVQHLRLLNAAVESGHAIGQVAALNDKELRALIANPPAVVSEVKAMKAARAEDPAPALRAVLAAIERLDYGEAERELALLATVLTARELVHRVALPLMQHVGDAWHQGRLGVAHEHMTSALVRNLLGALIPLHRRTSPASKLLFATPSGEQHEFGILLSAMLAVGGGLGIVYLGAHLPAAEILGAAQQTAPQAVVLGFIGANDAKTGLAEIQQLARKLPSQIELWIGGTQEESLIKEIRKTRALPLEDFVLLEQHLVRLGARF